MGYCEGAQPTGGRSRCSNLGGRLATSPYTAPKQGKIIVKATVKITAVLRDPTSTWEDEITIPMPPGTTETNLNKRAVMLAAINVVQATGLNRLVDEEMEHIPWHRVSRITCKLETSTITESLDVAGAAAAAKAGKLVHA